MKKVLKLNFSMVVVNFSVVVGKEWKSINLRIEAKLKIIGNYHLLKLLFCAYPSVFNFHSLNESTINYSNN